MKSATAAAITRPSHSGNSRTRIAASSSAVSKRRTRTASGTRQAGRPRREGHARPPVARGLGERVAHFPARPVGDEADGIDRLPRRAGRHEQPHPGEVPVTARRDPPGFRDDRVRLGHAPDAALVPRPAGRFRARSSGLRGRRGSARSGGPPRGPTSPIPSRAPRAPVPGARGNTSTGNRRRAPARTCPACARSPARRGADRTHRRARRGRPRASSRRPRPPCSTSWRERTANVSGATNSRAPRVIATRTSAPRERQAPEDFDGLVGGDAPADAEEDARGPAHGSRGTEGLAGRLFLDQIAFELVSSPGSSSTPPSCPSPQRISSASNSAAARRVGLSGRSVSILGRAPRMSCSARRAMRSTRRNLLSTPFGHVLNHGQVTSSISIGSLCAVARGPAPAAPVSASRRGPRILAQDRPDPDHHSR